MSRAAGHSARTDIMDAVMRLLSEKLYMDITVSDIIRCAGVARASFYRSFRSISDVLDAIVEDMSDELVADVFPTLRSNDERKWREFLFQHFYRFSRNQRTGAPIRKENVAVFFHRMDRRIQEKDTIPPAQSIRERYVTAAKMGLINSVTRRWLDTGMQETPEELIDYIMSFITKF